jgi:hypothetical protein
MGDQLTGPDIDWVTINHEHIPFNSKTGARIPTPKRPLSPAERGAMAARVTPEVRKIALESQKEVARLVGGRVIPDNGAHDVVVGRNVIEVKTLVDAKNDKLPLQRVQRLYKNASDSSYRHWTIGVDKRGGQTHFFLFPGHGSFRIWKKVNPTPPEVIRDLFRGGKI